MVAFRQSRPEMVACSDLYTLTDELLLRLREASLSLWPSTDSRSVNLLVALGSLTLTLLQKKKEELIRSRVECFHPPPGSLS